ncbi:MAG: ArnT family glycosyltransferase [Planctomycetota bacterium]
MTDGARASEPGGRTERRSVSVAEDAAESSRTVGALRDLLLIGAVFSALLLPAMLATELTTTDEARYTQVAREMRLANEWLGPRLNGGNYWEKPALFFDLLQLPQRLTGEVTPLGSRLVILPFALAVLAFTYGCARILAGRRAAILSALILATTALFHQYSHSAVLDIPMLAFITLAFLAHLIWTRTDAPTARWQLIAALAMGVGCHFKGPVAILLPGAVMAVDGLSRQGARALLSPAILWMPAVSLLVLGLWFVPMAQHYGDPFVGKMLGHHVAERAAAADAPHAREFHYYLRQWPVASLPWSLLIPFALVASLGSGLTAGRGRGRALQREESPLRYPLLWWVTIVLLLSLISSKRTQYLLPAFPGFAVWLGVAFDLWLRQDSLATIGWRRTVVAVRVFATTLSVAGLVIALIGLAGRMLPGVITAPEGTDAAMTAALESGWLVGVGLFVAATLGWVAGLARRGSPRALLLALLLLGTAANFTRSVVIEGFRDDFIRPNEFGEEMRSLLAADGIVAIYAMRLNGTYLLHSGATHFETVLEPEETLAFLAGDGARAVVGKRRYLREYIWPQFEEQEICVLATHREGRSQVVLFGNAEAVRLWRMLHPDQPIEIHSPAEFAPETASPRPDSADSAGSD